MTAPGSRGLEASESSLSQVTHELRVSDTWEGEVADPLASLCSPGWLQGSGQIVFFTARLCTSTILELTPKKDVLFIIGDWNAKVGSQETPGVTGKFGLGVQNESGQRLIEFCQEKHHVPTTQEKTLQMEITRWSTPKSD